jgi:hypothetical protein
VSWLGFDADELEDQVDAAAGERRGVEEPPSPAGPELDHDESPAGGRHGFRDGEPFNVLLIERRAGGIHIPPAERRRQEVPLITKGRPCPIEPHRCAGVYTQPVCDFASPYPAVPGLDRRDERMVLRLKGGTVRIEHEPRGALASEVAGVAGRAAGGADA